MWKLIYEDTFGFGEDRDPPKIEVTGENDIDGFYKLWTSVLNESITGTPEKPKAGFARFTLLINLPNKKSKSISIDVNNNIKNLAKLKYEMNNNRIKEISTRHYEAYIKNEENLFWNNFNRQKNNFKVFALNLNKKTYIKKTILFSMLLVFANVLFLFCLLSEFYFFSSNRTFEAIIAGLMALIFLLLNLTGFNIKELSQRYKHPDKFYIEIDETNFIHSNGKSMKKIELEKIKNFREEKIWTRSGYHIMYVVDYLENLKPKTYSFYKFFSKHDIMYDIPAEKIKTFIK